MAARLGARAPRAGRPCRRRAAARPATSLRWPGARRAVSSHISGIVTIVRGRQREPRAGRDERRAEHEWWPHVTCHGARPSVGGALLDAQRARARRPAACAARARTAPCRQSTRQRRPATSPPASATSRAPTARSPTSPWNGDRRRRGTRTGRCSSGTAPASRPRSSPGRRGRREPSRGGRARRLQAPGRLEQHVDAARPRAPARSSAPLSGSTVTRRRSPASVDRAPAGRLAVLDRHAHQLRQRLEDEPVGGQAAVHAQVDARDAGRVVGGQEREGRGDLATACTSRRIGTRANCR